MYHIFKHFLIHIYLHDKQYDYPLPQRGRKKNNQKKKKKTFIPGLFLLA